MVDRTGTGGLIVLWRSSVLRNNIQLHADRYLGNFFFGFNNSTLHIMRIKNLAAGFCAMATIVVLPGCGGSDHDYERIVRENEMYRRQVSELRKENDELKNGSARLSSQIDQAYAEKRFADAKDLIDKLKARHPDCARNAEFSKLSEKLSVEISAALEKARLEALEKIRLENLNNTGMWNLKQYVDDFGIPTKAKYVSSSKAIPGVFSNSATQDSPLNVRILADLAPSIGFILYEYAGNNPVKVFSKEEYRVDVLSDSGQRSSYHATNQDERVYVDVSQVKMLQAVLSSGGRVKFVISNLDKSHSIYRFELVDCSGFSNALRMLSEPDKN